MTICPICNKKIHIQKDRVWVGRESILYHFDCHPDSKQTKPEGAEMQQVRKFETGATRDTIEGKLSYVKALSPIVLRRYMQYLAKHRKQSDGSMREFDNWKKGIPIDTYLDSLGRHVMDLWLMMHDFPAEDNHGLCDKQELLCAIMFNSMGMLHELLKEELKGGRKCCK